jgi:hypothetical protein
VGLTSRKKLRQSGPRSVCGQPTQCNWILTVTHCSEIQQHCHGSSVKRASHSSKSAFSGSVKGFEAV